MFDAEDDSHVGVCRDESCDVDYVHPSHAYALRPEEPLARGRPTRPWWLEKDPSACRRADPQGLIEVMRRVFEATDWPLAFVDIKHAVRNDYGTVSPRSIHRHVRRLIGQDFVVQLDLGLSKQAYIRKGSRYIHDLDNLRQHMLGRNCFSFNAQQFSAATTRPTHDQGHWG